jgi:hypothetical protein
VNLLDVVLGLAAAPLWVGLTLLGGSLAACAVTAYLLWPRP